MDKICLNQATKIPLPYSLNALEVKNFQGIKHLHLQDLPCDAQWIFLVGENAAGKTSILRSIAECFSGNPYDEIDILYNDRNGKRRSPEAHYPKRKYEIPIVGYGISRFNLLLITNLMI